MGIMIRPHCEAVEKRDWLRPETPKSWEELESPRCLSQFLHSLYVNRILANSRTRSAIAGSTGNRSMLLAP